MDTFSIVILGVVVVLLVVVLVLLEKVYRIVKKEDK